MSNIRIIETGIDVHPGTFFWLTTSFYSFSCYNTIMIKQTLIEIVQASVIGAMFFGPLFYYIW